MEAGNLPMNSAAAKVSHPLVGDELQGQRQARSEYLIAGAGRRSVRRGGLHVPPGIDRGVVHADFVMDVWTGGTPADACITDHFTTLDPGSGYYGVGREMRVPSG